VNGDRISALRHAREIIYDMRWRDMTVPPLYTSMAEEFQALVRSGAYAAWVATSGKATYGGSASTCSGHGPGDRQLGDAVGEAPPRGRCLAGAGGLPLRCDLD
jgi:hypothetical protein